MNGKPATSIPALAALDKPAVRFTWLNHYALAVLLFFGVIYACSQSYVYVEGDDASNVAFHALGRTPSIQPPYSAYNGMMDVLLGVLPAREAVVRSVGLFLSSLAAIGCVVLALKLAFDWMGKLRMSSKAFAAVVALVAIPELFFFGLVYTPNLVAMCALFGAHLVLRSAVNDGRMDDLVTRRSLLPVVVSLALFGFGVSCRWETASYGLVIVTDIWVGFTKRRFTWPSLRQVLFGFVWGGLALASALAFIAMSGYGMGDLRNWVEMSRQASSGHFDTGLSFFAFVGRYQSFLTPLCVGLMAIGMGSLVLQQRALALKSLIGLLPVWPMLYYGAPKMLLVVLPGVFACLVTGFDLLWFADASARARRIWRAGILVVALAPWLIGARVYSESTQWGPGFEIRTAGSEGGAGDAGIESKQGKRHVNISRTMPAFGGGFAVATPEGPRPLGGFAAVLFGGQWRALVNQLEEEREAVIREAVSSGRPILQDDANSLIVAHLLGNGFSTTNPRKVFHSGYNTRHFKNDAGREVTFLQLQERPSLFEPEQLRTLMEQAGAAEVIVYSNYSSSLSKLFRTAPHAARPLGAFSAIVDLRQLYAALADRRTRATEQAREARL